jgi:putative ABC transport system ATP-binding protein
VISVAHLKKDYDHGLVQALRGISFEVEKGETVSIMGPSGCGKSTLLNLIGTLDLPTEGEIRVDGKPLADYRPFDSFRAKTIGFIFQFHHLIPNLSLLENVELPLYSFPISKRVRRDKAIHLLEEMGLEDRMHFLPTRVSGGERQRAAIARALINNPPIILADEPTGNVDPLIGNRIMDFLLDLCGHNKMTLIIATHNHEIAARTRRTIRIKNGQVDAISLSVESA